MKFQEVFQHLYFAAFLKKEGIFQQPVFKYLIRACFIRNGVKWFCLWKRLPLDFWWGADLLEELVQFHSCIFTLHLIQNVFLLATWSRILSQHCKGKIHSGLGIPWQYAFIKSLKCKCMEKCMSYPITELHSYCIHCR